MCTASNLRRHKTPKLLVFIETNEMHLKHYSFQSFVLCVVLLASCATNKATKETAELSEPRKSDAIAKMLKNEAEPQEKKEAKEASSSTTRSPSEIENLTIDEVIRIEEPNTANLYDNSRYDFPITMNSKVEGWIDYFTGRGREHMERYLSRSSRYLPLMKQTFKAEGLPEDLVYLALIESGFNLRAKSRARAVGPWQFMKATGKRYGLRVDAWVDERRDPIRSTVAAANYLKDLYLMFESWYLAASAYNAGEYKILRAIDETKTNNYWRICQTKMLRRETKDYVPKLIAAAIIGKNAKKYGFDDVEYEDPLTFDMVTVNYPVKLKELAKTVNASEDDILDLNPSFVKGMVPPTGTYTLRIPSGMRLLAERTLSNQSGKAEASDLPLQYTVKNGETIQSIAGKHGMRAKELANANNLSPKEKLVGGSILLIPYKGKSFKSAPVATAKRSVSAVAPPEPANPTAEEGFLIHTVKSGESLWSISEDYNVTVQNIFRWNNLKKSAIHPGRKLKIKSSKNVDSRNNVRPKSRRS